MIAIIAVVAWRGCMLARTGHQVKFLEVMEILYDFIETVVMCTCPNSSFIAHTRYVHFPAYQIYLIRQKSNVS